jgi:hypothetical protein
MEPQDNRHQRRNLGKDVKKNVKNAIDKVKEDEFLKVRPGETIEEWQKRTEKVRVLTEKEHDRLCFKYKTKRDRCENTVVCTFPDYKEKKIQKEYSENQLKHILKSKHRKGLVLYRDKRDPFFHFKYYFLITKWAEIRYGVRKADLDFLMHLYCLDRPFRKREIDEKTFIISGASFNIYMKKGYIYRMKYSQVSNNYLKRGYSPYYNLTHPCKKMMNAIIALMLGDVEKITIRRLKGTDTSKVREVRDFYYDLRREVKEMEQGLIPTDRFYPIDLNRDALMNPDDDN